MTEKEWQEILADMDREDANASRRYRNHNLSFDWMGEFATQEREENQWEEDIEKAMRKLTWKQRRILKLLYFRGYIQKEAAHLCRCTESAVSRLKRKALSELKKIL